MDKTESILQSTSHRQYPLPEKPWKQYQEWHRNLMLHWKIESSLIKGLLPDGLKLDNYEDGAWISIIAFTVKKLHPRFFPPMSFFSDFHEVNLRTYVIRDGIPGIYFFSIEAQNYYLQLWREYLLDCHMLSLLYADEKILMFPSTDVKSCSWILIMNHSRK
jgi:uncharacterized protein YqjF (DUF2071 family)